MFDFGGFEILAIVVLAVLVLGPKELPQAMRAIAKVVRKVRGLASEFQGHVNEIVREAELEDVRKSVQQFSSTNVGAQVNKMIDPEGEIGETLKDPLKDIPTKTDSEGGADDGGAKSQPLPDNDEMQQQALTSGSDGHGESTEPPSEEENEVNPRGQAT